MSRAAATVLPAIRDAAVRTGADFTALFQMARVESGLRLDARAAGSSARGLFQFLDSTWLDVLEKHGAANGIPQLSRGQALALRDDPGIASLMAAEHMQDNAALLERSLGRRADAVDLYFAHFLGAAGAGRFLGALERQPEAYGAALFPAAARANRAIFYSGATPRSLAEIHQLVGARLQEGGTGPATTASPVAAGRSAAAGAAAPGGLLPGHAGVVDSLATPGSTSAAAPIAPRDAARIAYLLLAEMGG